MRRLSSFCNLAAMKLHRSRLVVALTTVFMLALPVVDALAIVPHPYGRG